MGLKDELAADSIRFSLGRFTTENDISIALQKTIDIVSAMKAG
jgi:cysteine sulfinate desulfinase/cysteine desulfurase-like protein